MRMTGITRRRMMAASAGAVLSAGGAAAGRAAGGAAAARGDATGLATAAGRLRAFMLMRAALDDRLVIGCLSARYYGVVDDEVTPLFGVVSATFAQFRPAAGGGYEGASFEVPFYTDLETGKVLSRWTNHYTGEEVQIPRTSLPPAKIAISQDMTVGRPNPPPGVVSDQRVIGPTIRGDDVWIVEQNFVTVAPQGASRPQRYNEVVTLHARKAELEVPDIKRVRCETAYDSMSSWRGWMNMRDHPGHVSGIGFGGYGVALDDLPGAWLETVRAERPALLEDPGAALTPLLKG